MLRKFTLLGLFVYCSSAHSQTLTQSGNEPVIGDINTYYPMDTSLFITGLPIGVTGSTSVWNFTNLKSAQQLVTENYLSPSSSTASVNYTGCTVVQNSGTLYTYIKSTTTPTTQTEVLGLTSNTLSLTFTNSAVVLKYPVNYGYTSSDNLAGSFTYSVTGTCTGNITSNADGLGTLNLANSQTFSNVLRVKSVQTISLSAALVPPLPPTQVGTIKQTIYNYYHSSKKFPIVSVNYTAISFITSTTPTVTGFVTGNSAYFTAPPIAVGITELGLNESEISIYPNPSHNDFNFQLANPTGENCTMEIYNLTGQMVKSFKFGTSSPVQELISTSDLNKGLYFVKTSVGNKTSTNKLFIE